MAQLTKMLRVLDLFNESRPAWTAEEVADALALSRPTAFRYVRELTEAGMLARLSGRYSLGARIVELDYRIRRLDPLLNAGLQPMHDLVSRTACMAVLSSLYGDRIVNVHVHCGPDRPHISFERGRPLPLFRGSASKTILAHLPRARLKKLFEANRDQFDVQAIAADWEGFARYFRGVRRAGYYVSSSEVDAGVTGVAAPIFNEARQVIGSLALVYEGECPWIRPDALGRLTIDSAGEITQRLANAVEAPANAPARWTQPGVSP
jgi:DNA-binding IclR family transcriptional regulator